jgi:hypothetical protein
VTIVFFFNIVNTDEEIIHLVTRPPESNTNTQSSAPENNNQQQPNINFGNLGNMFGNLVNNPNAMIQISSVILDDLGRPSSNSSSQRQGNPLDAIFQNLLNPQGISGQSTSNAQSGIQTNVNNINTTTQNVNNTQNTSSTSNIISNNQTNPVDITDQYPILKPANQHINNLLNVINTITGGNNSNLPNIPNHNYPRNILIAISYILKNWANQVSRFFPYVSLLAEGLERESLLNNTEERNKLQELARKVTTGLNEIAQGCNSIHQTMNGLNVGTGPGLGYTTLLHTSLNAVSLINPNTTNNQNTNINLQSEVLQTNNNTQQQSNTNNESTQPMTSTQSRNNPLSQVLNQLNQPGGLQNMMSMVGSLLNNPNTAGNLNNMMNSLTGGGNTNINNLLSSLMNAPDDEEVSEHAEEIVFKNIVLLNYLD